MRAARHELSQPRGTTFNHVLVWGIPLHDAPILLRQAAAVVAPGGGRIRLLEPRARSTRDDVEPLDQAVDSINQMGVALEREVLDEGAAEDIVRLAIAGKHDLVVKGVAAGDTRRRTLTAADLALVRRGPCPVWFVECAEPRAPRRILAALDPEAGTDKDRALARRVATVGAGLAAVLGAELHVIHVWSVFGEQLIRNRMSPDELDECVRSELEATRQFSASILADSHLDLPPARIQFRKGVFATVLPAVVTDGDFDLIVMGTRGRKGWLDSVVRPQAETCLCNTPISIFVVRTPMHPG